MVSFKVDAEVKGSEDQEKYPIVAKVKGTGKDGSLSVQVSGESSAPISAKISGDNNNPISVAPIVVAPITVVPDLRLAAESIDIKGLISSISKLAEGIKVSISNQNGQPVALALGKIPVDLTISVYSPAQEQVFKVEIKGTVGEK
ncbi:Uncharacterised protein [uncultured archaeon]|nr:Uncharacterised protein [uncultured archaeon]